MTILLDMSISGLPYIAHIFMQEVELDEASFAKKIP